MNNLRKKTYILVMFLGFIVTQATYAATPTKEEYGAILNLSGKQRMLSQKMTKEALLIALDIDIEKNTLSLSSTASLFDKTLLGLKNGDASLKLPPTEQIDIVNQLAVVEGIWADFHPLIKKIVESKSANADQILLLAEKNIPLLKEMNKAVELYAKDAEKTGLKTEPGLATKINLSGKQRMLTQKMSKEFFLVALKHNPDENIINLQETSELFDTTLTGLIRGDDSLGLSAAKEKNILNQLDLVDGLWYDFKDFIEQGIMLSDDKIPEKNIKDIAYNNLPLLKEMNAAVKLFEKQATN